MVQKFTFQICQKFAIAAALVATFYCLPVVAQTTQANETLILNNKPITFAEFLKTYPNQAVRSKVLATLDEKAEDAFRDWEMAQLNKINAEKTARLEAKKEELVEKTAALKLITEMNIVLDELTKEQAASKPVIPEQQIINKKRAMTIMAALANPEIASRMKPEIASILRIISDNLQKGGNLTQLNIDLVRNVKILPSK